MNQKLKLYTQKIQLLQLHYVYQQLLEKKQLQRHEKLKKEKLFKKFKYFLKLRLKKRSKQQHLKIMHHSNKNLLSQQSLFSMQNSTNLLCVSSRLNI
jgi:hypothetical protein